MDELPSTRQFAKDVLAEYVNDATLRKDFATKLGDYMHVSCDDVDDPDIGSFIRYIDRRDFPPVLRKGGYVANVSGDMIQLKAGPRIWKIYKRYVVCFQKKRHRDHLMDAVTNLLQNY